MQVYWSRRTPFFFEAFGTSTHFFDREFLIWNPPLRSGTAWRGGGAAAALWWEELRCESVVAAPAVTAWIWGAVSSAGPAATAARIFTNRRAKANRSPCETNRLIAPNVRRSS